MLIRSFMVTGSSAPPEALLLFCPTVLAKLRAGFSLVGGGGGGKGTVETKC